MLTLISSKKRTKAHHVFVKTNSFVRFLEEFRKWQFSFKIIWPLHICHSIFENWKKRSNFFYLLYILTSFLSLSFSICCYSEINRALSYRPKWVSKPRPYRNGIYDGRSTCGRGSHDASPAAGWIQLRLPTSSRGLLAILRTSVVQVRIQPFFNYFDRLLGRSKKNYLYLISEAVILTDFLKTF